MSKVAFAAVAVMATGLASAHAADLPYGSRAPYTVNQPLNAFSWAGPYLGGNLGYNWGSVDNNPAKPSGVLGGVGGGYNWQTGQWVFGVEGDLQANGAEDTFAPWKFSNPWFGTVRGRVGYAFNNVLLYGTGGLAFGSLRAETSACRRPMPAPAGPRASAPKSVWRRTGAPRSNTSTSIWPTAASPSPACRTAISSAWFGSV
jgi:outer membrane immunogenic protein